MSSMSRAAGAVAGAAHLRSHSKGSEAKSRGLGSGCAGGVASKKLEYGPYSTGSHIVEKYGIVE